MLTALAGGRCSRLHRLLVEERRLCSSVGAEIDETVGPGVAMLACELLPGASPTEVEARLLAELGRLAGGGLEPDEIARARRLLVADWVFGRETVSQEALATATAISSLRRPARAASSRADRELLARRAAAGRRLCTWTRRGLVIGWSLPEARR